MRSKIVNLVALSVLTLVVMLPTIKMAKSATDNFELIEPEFLKIVELKQEDAKEGEKIPFKYALYVEASKFVLPIIVFVKNSEGKVIGRMDELVLPLIKDMIDKKMEDEGFLYVNTAYEAMVLSVNESDLVLNPENEHEELLKELIESDPARLKIKGLESYLRSEPMMSKEILNSMYI